MTVEYFYKGIKPSKVEGVLSDASGSVAVGNMAVNPVFNFPLSFMNDLNSVSPIQLGQSIPYISLSTVDTKGEISENLNISHFHKPINVNNIAAGGRFADRPGMSLKSLELKTDQAGGYFYYTNVSLGLKVHSPDSLENSEVLMSMLVPGSNLLLEYGWNSPNEFLDQKEKMFFQVQTYNLTIDTTGQIDITVQGMALNETLNNTYLGDVEVANKLKKLEEKTKIIKELKEKKKKNQAIKTIISEESNVTKEFGSVSKELRAEFSTAMKSLRSPEPEKINFDKNDKKAKKDVVRFHDLIYKLCNKTFEDLVGLLPVKKISVIYGTFNESTQTAGIKNIADFPVNLKRFEKELKIDKKNGYPVITIKKLFNTLLSDLFVGNTNYWTGLLPDKEKENWKTPDMAVRFSNNGEEAIIYFLDVGGDIPLTLTGFLKLDREESENLTKESEVEKSVISAGVPIIRLGHANSFIKNASMSHIIDQHMKAVLIERANSGSKISKREPTTQSKKDEGASLKNETPFTLPLRGSMTVLGHVGWKPFRVFYLSAGVYVINAVYKILGVQHKLSSEGFETTIDFMYH